MSEKIKALGKRVYIIPFAVALVIFCVLGVAVAPMMHMAPRGVPVAMVNLDEGAALPNGTTLVAGDMVVENLDKIVSGMTEDGEEAPMTFTVLSSRDELDAAMDAGEYYGAIVIPADFTKKQMTGDPSIELVVNTAKSPLFASTFQTSVGQALGSQGIEVELTSIGDAPASASPISSIMSVQMIVMPLSIMSIVMSLLIVVFKWLPVRGATRGEKGKVAVIQVVFCIAASFVAAALAYGIVVWLGGADVPADAILFLWHASACIMLANTGLCDLSLPLGAVVMVCMFALGMCTAVLPPEMLPPFWADLVVPWAPQEAIGNGLRNIIYLHGGPFDVGCAKLLAWGCVGLVALLLAIAVPSRKRQKKAE